MSGAPTLALNTPLRKLRQHVRYTLQRTQLRSWGKAWVALLEAEVKGIDAALATELKVTDALDDAETAIHAADGTLDGLARTTVYTGRQYNAAGALQDFLHDLLGNETLSAFSDRLLGKQLDRMRHWPGYLKTRTAPALQALAPKIEAALKAADDAVAAHTSAEVDMATFRSVTQAPLIKKVNELFQQVLGEARKQALALGDPAEAKGLFLLTEQRRRRRAALLSIPRAESTVTACEQALAAAKQHLLDLRAEVEAEAEAAAERRVREERIAALRKQRQQTDAEIAQLEASQRKGR